MCKQLFSSKKITDAAFSSDILFFVMITIIYIIIYYDDYCKLLLICYFNL